MKNSDMPVTAQSNDEIVKAFMDVEGVVAPNGLTKREVFAMAAMQGLLAEGLTTDNLYLKTPLK